MLTLKDTEEAILRMKGLEDQDEENVLAMSEPQGLDEEEDPEVNWMRQGFRGKRGNIRGNRFMRGSNRGYDTRGGKKRHACYNCESEEHWARECPEPQKNEKTKRNRQEDKTHEMGFCQTKEETSSERDEIFAVSVNNEFCGSVIIDSRASKSVIGKQRLMKILSQCDAKLKECILSDQQGKNKLEFRFGKGDAVCSSSVIHLPV